MKYRWFCLCPFLLVVALSSAAPKPHVISFGKWTNVKSLYGTGERQAIELKIRTLLVDGHAKEFTLGLPHEVTEQLFVVRRVLRLNDSLPEDAPGGPRWVWHPEGWLMVDRATGRITAVNLPQFDAVSSEVNWYRDYAAYCGASDDGQKLYAMLVELGRRKPILAKAFDASKSSGPACPAPRWQRLPPRVTFDMGNDQSFTYTVREHAASVAMEGPEEN